MWGEELQKVPVVAVVHQVDRYAKLLSLIWIWLMRQWMKSIIAVIDHHMHTLDLDEMISTTTMRIPNSTILQAIKRPGKAWEGG